MKFDEKQRRQTYFACGIVFVVLGISMVGSNRGRGIVFIACSLMFFALSGDMFRKNDK